MYTTVHLGPSVSGSRSWLSNSVTNLDLKGSWTWGHTAAAQPSLSWDQALATSAALCVCVSLFQCDFRLLSPFPLPAPCLQTFGPPCMLLGKTGTISVRCQRSFISGSGGGGLSKVIIMGCNFSQDCTIVTYITIREWDNCEQWKLKCLMGSEEQNKREEQVDTTAAPINCTHWFWWYRTSLPTGSPVFSPTFLWLWVFWIPSHYYKQTRFRKSFCDRHKSKASELFVLLASDNL